MTIHKKNFVDRESELVTIHGRRSRGTGAPPFTELRKWQNAFLFVLEISYLLIEQLFANMHQLPLWVGPKKLFFYFPPL